MIRFLVKVESEGDFDENAFATGFNVMKPVSYKYTPEGFVIEVEG